MSNLKNKNLSNTIDKELSAIDVLNRSGKNELSPVEWNEVYLNDLENIIFTDLNRKKYKIKKIMETGNFNAAKDIPPWYIILPNQQSKKLWDILNCMVCIVSILMVTSDIAYNFECITNDNGDSIHNLYILFFVISIIDIVICCVTAYLDERNNYSYDVAVIVSNYLRSGVLVTDVLSTLPWFIIIPFNQKDCFQPYISYKKEFYFFTFLKIMKINKFFELIERIAPKYTLILRLIKLFSSIIFLANIIGLLFCGNSPTVSTMLTSDCIIYPETSLEYANCIEKIFKTKFWNIYFYSLYIGLLMTMGNDFSTQQKFEMLILIICMVLSTIMNASIYGNVAVILSKVSGGVSPILREKIDTMNEYMNYMKFESIFKMQIEEYHLNIWFKQRNMMYDDTVFGDMSFALQKILLLQQWKPTFFIDSKLLKLISGNFMLDMVLKLKPKIFMTNDIIITEGESNTEVYFNSRTCLCKIYIGGQWIKDIEKGEYFGEIAIFLRSRRRTSTVLSGRDSDFLFISGNDFQEILRNYPDDLAKIRNVAIQTLMESMKFYPSNLFAKLVPNNNLKDYLFRKSIHCEDEEEDFHFNDDQEKNIDLHDYNYKINQINALMIQVKDKLRAHFNDESLNEEEGN